MNFLCLHSQSEFALFLFGHCTISHANCWLFWSSCLAKLPLKSAYSQRFSLKTLGTHKDVNKLKFYESTLLLGPSKLKLQYTLKIKTLFNWIVITVCGWHAYNLQITGCCWGGALCGAAVMCLTKVHL